MTRSGRRTVRAAALAVLAVVVATVVAGCVVNARRGSGTVVDRVVEVSAFRRIEVTSGVTVRLRSGPTTAVTVTADDNLVDDVDVSVVRDTLRIRLQPGVTATRATLRVEVVVPADAPAPEAFRLSGAARVEADDPLQTRTLAVTVDGAATFVAELDVGSLTVDASGASRVRFDGDATSAVWKVSGASAVDASDLLSSEVVADVSGGSSVQLLANDTADLEASGASRIRWSGDATLTRADSTGASSITRVDEPG